MSRSRSILALAAGTLAFGLTLAVTEPAGPGLDPDAMAYLHAAGSLVRGGVLLDVRDDWVSPDSTRPLTRWPPGFPVAIAAPLALGMTPAQSARLVMALAALAALATLVWTVSGASGLGAAAAVAAVLLVTPAVALVHENVLSEPLFLATLALTLALMARARPAPLAAGAAAGAASLVRYAGLSAIGAVMLWELFRDGAWRTRLRNAALAAAPGAIANGWWWLRAARLGGRTAVRHFSVYGEIGPTLREGGETVTAWLAPRVGAGAGWVAAAAAAVVVMAAGLGTRHSALGDDNDNGDGNRVSMAALVLAGSYLGLVLAARVLADPEIPLDERILVPAMVLLTVAAGVWMARWWRSAGRWWRGAAGAALTVWGVASFRVARESVGYALETGSDYADLCWVHSPVVEWVRAHGDRHALLSNSNVALYFQAGRLARVMPVRMSAARAAAFADTLAARQALVVLFDRTCAPIDEPDSLVAALGLVPEAALGRGTVWRPRAAAAPTAAGAPH